MNYDLSKLFLILVASFSISLLAHALSINQPILASTFLASPLEVVEIELNGYRHGRGAWKIDFGHALNLSNRNKINWTSTVREGVYPIANGRMRTYILVGFPTSTISREEFAYLLSLFMPAISFNWNAPDLSADHWSKPMLTTCLGAGIMQLYPNNTLRPFDPIRRVEAAKMLFEFINNLNLQNNDNYIDSINALRDVTAKHWAAEAVGNTLMILPPLDYNHYGAADLLTFGQARQVFENLRGL